MNFNIIMSHARNFNCEHMLLLYPFHLQNTVI